MKELDKTYEELVEMINQYFPKETNEDIDIRTKAIYLAIDLRCNAYEKGLNRAIEIRQEVQSEIKEQSKKDT